MYFMHHSPSRVKRLGEGVYYSRLVRLSVCMFVSSQYQPFLHPNSFLYTRYVFIIIFSVHIFGVQHIWNGTNVDHNVTSDDPTRARVFHVTFLCAFLVSFYLFIYSFSLFGNYNRLNAVNMGWGYFLWAFVQLRKKYLFFLFLAWPEL